MDAAAAIPTPCPMILSHWGWDLKAYQYGQIVTGQLACARIVTLDDDLRGMLKDGKACTPRRISFTRCRKTNFDSAWAAFT